MLVVFATDPAYLVGGFFAGVSALLGTYATVVSRRTEDKTATREETETALKAQDALLNRYEKRIDDLEKRQETLEEKVVSAEKKAEDAIAARNDEIEAHRRCEERLNEANTLVQELQAKLEEFRHGT